MKLGVICIASATLALLASPLLSATEDEVVTALSSKYTLAKVSKLSWTVSTPGTELVVQKAGMFVGDPMGMNRWIQIINGALAQSGSGQVGGGFFGSGTAGHELKVGDRVYIWGIKANGENNGYLVQLMTVSTFDVPKGRTTKTEHGVANVRFAYSNLASMSVETALADFSKWFSTEQEASQSRTIKIGQTPSEVESILGPPEKRIDLGTKQIFVYKDMKVVFVDGKVSDVQ